ncbi:MAG: hypothetical protein RMM31_09720 [Anaerolineae bacterium]|nr:hypothetical protein [Thermoflexales bacterium]MDW8396506.1 hypothetical protein [Anaerolineae bacterium]
MAAKLALLEPLFVQAALASGWADCADPTRVFAATCIDGQPSWFYPAQVAQGGSPDKLWRAFRGALGGSLIEVLRPLEEGRINFRVVYLNTEALVFVPVADAERAVTVLTRAGHAIKTPQDEAIEVKCSWRLPNGERAQASFLARVVTYDEAQDRWLVRLQEVRILSPADEASRDLIYSKVGCWAWVPSEARQGMTLPLKYETLTGHIRWFYAQDPRSKA